MSGAGIPVDEDRGVRFCAPSLSAEDLSDGSAIRDDFIVSMGDLDFFCNTPGLNLGAAPH
jgi:hypothetical protein